MELTRKWEKHMAWTSVAAFVIAGVLLGGVNLVGGNLSRALLGLAAPAFLLIPWLMKMAGLAHPYRFYILLFGFCLLAYDIGCVYQAFDAWPYYDKIVHFLSGILFTVVGFCLYLYLLRFSASGRESWLMAATYALFFSAFVAVIWEVGEFSGYLLTGHDSQHHLDTGVFDTMEDLISCLGGSLLSVGSYLLYHFKRIRLLTGSVVEEFRALCAAS